MSNRSMIIIYIIIIIMRIYIHVYMINLLPLRLICIRTYERDSDKERLREGVLPRFRVLKCCDFLWTVFLRAFSFFALTLSCYVTRIIVLLIYCYLFITPRNIILKYTSYFKILIINNLIFTGYKLTP